MQRCYCRTRPVRRRHHPPHGARSDAEGGRALSYQDKLDPLQAAYARSMLRKYFRQLGISAVNAMYDDQKKWMAV
jgi:hypothetical protein